MVFSDTTAKKELLTTLPMKEHRRDDIFQSFKNFIEKTQLPVYKLVAITVTNKEICLVSAVFIYRIRKVLHYLFARLLIKKKRPFFLAIGFAVSTPLLRHNHV